MRLLAAPYATKGYVVPKLDEVLELFALPFLAQAVREDRAKFEKSKMLTDLLALGERMGAKVEIKGIK